MQGPRHRRVRSRRSCGRRRRERARAPREGRNEARAVRTCRYGDSCPTTRRPCADPTGQARARSSHGPQETVIAAAGRILFGLAGLGVLIAIAWLFSENKRHVDWQEIPKGVVLQIALATVLLKVPLGRSAFDALARAFVKLAGFAAAGSQFVFGQIADPSK